ncbi:hypothetical protein [Clostridium sp.]|uniref:hypothetical protein n=1 Tax=Clostridium sp. TaxID=1506 RepID=UPI003D6CCF63
MQSLKNAGNKIVKLRGNNIVNNEKKLVDMYTSILSDAREGTVKLDLYALLNDQKEILGEIQHEVE